MMVSSINSNLKQKRKHHEKKNRDIEKDYSRKQFISKLRRLANSPESG
jgi:hypothetical protein